MEPTILTPQQAAVDAVCSAFGWPVALKAGHAAGWVKRTRTSLGLELSEFVTEFVAHYGQADPGPGVWWVYREVWPCKARKGDFPTPAIVANTWGRWERAVAVEVSGLDAFVALMQGSHVSGD